MDITIAKKDFVTALSMVQAVTRSKTTMPILSCALLTATKEGRLRVSGTDLYLAVSTTVPIETKQAGSLAVVAKDLIERVKLMPDGPIHVSTKDHNVILKSSGARRYTLRAHAGEDFPQLPEPSEDAPTMSIDIPVLRTLIAQTIISISHDETRAHLNSALFEWEGEIVRIVSTDSHRLTKAEATLKGRSATDSMLVPLKGIQELQRLCEGEGSIEIAKSGSTIFFIAPSVTLSIKQVDAVFPPYKQVIPAHNAHEATIARATLLDIVKAVSVSADAAKGGGVRFDFAKGMLRVSAESEAGGDAHDEVSVSWDGSGKFALNAKYFIDALSTIDEAEIVLAFSSDLDPIVIRPAESSSLLGIIMPVRY